MGIYIAAHKAFSPPAVAGYIPLQVGAAGGNPLPYTGDDTGDNISDKNPHYCELTGLYWIWKNSRDDYKGLVHYRRYFTCRGALLTPEQIQKRLKNGGILLPRTEYLRESAWQEFCLHSGREQDLIQLRLAVERVDPAYLPAFDRVMEGNRLHLYNMLVAEQKTFDDYCAWLFAVLSALEPQVDMTGYTPYEQRLYGFLGERLLNVWVAHQNIPVCSCKVTNTESSPTDRLRLTLRRQKNRLLFALGQAAHRR